MILEIDGFAKRTRATIKKRLVPSIEKDQRVGTRPSGTSNDPMFLSDRRLLEK
jgi:hypothetical protein